LHRQDQLAPLLVLQDGDAHGLSGESFLEEVIEGLPFAHALGEGVDGDDEVFFLKSGFFGGGVHAVLTHIGDEKCKGVGGEVFLFSRFIAQVLDAEAAEGHAAHGPDAGAAGDIGLQSPAFGQVQGERREAITPLHLNGNGSGRGGAMKCPTDIGYGNSAPRPGCPSCA
jgi:hypothetical protein